MGGTVPVASGSLWQYTLITQPGWVKKFGGGGPGIRLSGVQLRWIKQLKISCCTAWLHALLHQKS